MSILDKIGGPVSRLNIDRLQEGDIIAMHMNGNPFSEIIAATTGVPSHTAMYLGNDNIIEADAGRVGIRKLTQKYLDCDHEVDFWVCRPKRAKVDVEKLISDSYAMNNLKYDTKGAIGAGLAGHIISFIPIWSPDQPNPLDNRDNYFCSEVFAKALALQGKYIKGEYHPVVYLIRKIFNWNLNRNFEYHTSNVTPSVLCGSSYFNYPTLECAAV